jgi:ABC-2 type transport system permease protein
MWWPASCAISTSLVFGVAFAIGYRSPGSLGQWLGALGILVLFLLALSWLSAALGILARSPEAANGLTFLIAFIPYASSAFVRVQTMPWWLRPVANNQPETAVANTIRGLLDGQAVGSDPWHAVAWSLGIMTLSVAAAGVLFRRRTH